MSHLHPCEWDYCPKWQDGRRCEKHAGLVIPPRCDFWCGCPSAAKRGTRCNLHHGAKQCKKIMPGHDIFGRSYRCPCKTIKGARGFCGRHNRNKPKRRDTVAELRARVKELEKQCGID